VLLRKIDEYYRPELEEDGIEPEIYILQDVSDGTRIEAYMFFSDVIYNLFAQIYIEKIIYAKMLMREMKEKIDSDSKIYSDALNI